MTASSARCRNPIRARSASNSSGKGVIPSRLLRQLDVPKLALSPERSGDQDDDRAEYRANNFAPLPARRKAGHHPEHRQQLVESAADRTIEQTQHHWMNRRIGRDDVAG